MSIIYMPIHDVNDSVDSLKRRKKKPMPFRVAVTFSTKEQLTIFKT